MAGSPWGTSPPTRQRSKANGSRRGIRHSEGGGGRSPGRRPVGRHRGSPVQGGPRRRQPRPRRVRHGARGALRHLRPRRGPRRCRHGGPGPDAGARQAGRQRMNSTTPAVDHLGFPAGIDAYRDAGDTGADPARSAVVAGVGIGGLATLEDQEKVLIERGPTRVTPFLVPMMMPNATPAILAMELGWTGPNICVATACAAGTHAVGEGARLIRDNTADVVLAGGAEAVVVPIAIAAFARMGALSSRHDDPAAASRPFDA